MIRVLHVIDHLGLGGAQTALLDMLRKSDRAVFENEVAVMHGWGPFADELEKLGFRVHSLSPAKWPPTYLVKLTGLLRGGDFDITHFHLQGANWLAKPLAALAGQPVRIAHDHTSGSLRFRGWWSLLPDALSHLFSTRVIAVSDGVRDFLVTWEAVPRDAVEVVPNGVDTDEFRPASANEKASARAQWNLPQEAFVVGGMGRLAFEKNFILLPELAQRLPEIVFVVAGSGPEEEKIRALAGRLGVASHLRLLGSVTQRPEFYHALDAFILPSLYEGLPMALLEAMSSGVPVLCSRLEGIAAALSEGQEGLLAAPGDVPGFVARLSKLEASRELRDCLADAGRKKVTDSFSASATARRVEEVYREELAIAHKPVADKTIH